MKKILLLVALATFSLTSFGQKVWDFQNTTVWPISSGIGAGPNLTVVTDGLSIHTGSATATNMGQVEASGKKFDGVDFPNRFKFNGGGYPSAADTQTDPVVGENQYYMPTQRYISFKVGGDATIEAYGFTGSNSSARRLFVTDGTKKIGEFVFPISSEVPSGEGVKGIVNYVGPATTLYLFGNASINLYRLSTTNYVASSVNTIDANKTIVSQKYYDVLGREIQNNSRGLVIRKVTYDDGTSASLKTYIRTER